MSTTLNGDLQFAAPIELACASDGTRPALGKIQIRDGWAWATDSFVMARVPCDRPESQLPAAALNAARLRSSYRRTWINDSGDVAVDKGTETVTFPNQAMQTPDFARIWDPAVDVTETFVVAIDAKKLYDLARALGADRHSKKHCQVEITFNAANTAKPAHVRPCEANGAEGIIMPVRRRDR